MRFILLLLLLSACSEYNLSEVKTDTAPTDVSDVVTGSESETNKGDVDPNQSDDDTAANSPDDEECISSGEEVCDGIDNDCDGYIDEGDATNASIWYADADGDEYGNPAISIVACAPPSGYVADNTDCDDTWDRNHPDALEYCDFEDNDCDGLNEWNDPSAAWEVSWFDGDGDGFGGETSGGHCSVYGDMPEDHARTSDDCDDDNAEVYPGNGC